MRKRLYAITLDVLIGGNDLLMSFITARDYVSARPRAFRTNGMFRMPHSAPPRVGSPTCKRRWEDHQKICDAAESPLWCRRHHITKSTRGQPHSRRGGGHKGLVHHRPKRPRAEQDIPGILGFMWNEKRYVSLPVCLGDTARPFVPPQELRFFFFFPLEHN